MFSQTRLLYFYPLAHSFRGSRHVLPRRHQTTDAREVLSVRVFCFCATTLQSGGLFNFTFLVFVIIITSVRKKAVL